MPSALLPPLIEPETEINLPPEGPPREGGGSGGASRGGSGDGDRDRGRDPWGGGDRWGGSEGSEEVDRRGGLPQGIYRAGVLVAMVSITGLFAALTSALDARWVHAQDWVPVALPRVLYFNTGILFASSITAELARRMPGGRRHRGFGAVACDGQTGGERVARVGRGFKLWLYATLVLALAFAAGQLEAWKDLAERGVYLASNPGSTFFYVITAAHGVHLLGGLVALVCLAGGARRFAAEQRLRSVATAFALYWHFLDGLWVYLLILLCATVQQ